VRESTGIGIRSFTLTNYDSKLSLP
jgi:hypothetical protein